MARVMPSQVVQTIDELFPHAAKNQPGHLLSCSEFDAVTVIRGVLANCPDE
jgi:hypothetical protein